MMDLETALSFLAATLRLSTPLIFACLAGLWSERAGVVDVGLEGKMLAGACAGAAIASLTGSPWEGLGGAVLASLALAAAQAYAEVERPVWRRAHRVQRRICRPARSHPALMNCSLWHRWHCISLSPTSPHQPIE